MHMITPSASACKNTEWGMQEKISPLLKYAIITLVKRKYLKLNHSFTFQGGWVIVIKKGR